MKYDISFFIGRFQPIHKGHLALIKKGLDASRKVIIFCGSTNTSNNIKNPFSFNERKQMIKNSIKDQFGESSANKVIVLNVKDYHNDSLWSAKIKSIISQYSTPNDKIALIGFNKDYSTYYLDYFQDYDYLSVDNVYGISATKIREDYFNYGLINEKDVTSSIVNFLEDYKSSTSYQKFQEEFQYVKKNEEIWQSQGAQRFGGNVFLAVDAVITCKDHILIIEREKVPGLGLLSLPGGFVSAQEEIQDSLIKSIKNKTKIKVPESVLIGSIKTFKIFDKIDRSNRGRIVTHAYKIELQPNKDDNSIPKVKFGKWLPIYEVLNDEKITNNFFEDHNLIIQNMIQF